MKNLIFILAIFLSIGVSAQQQFTLKYEHASHLTDDGSDVVSGPVKSTFIVHYKNSYKVVLLTGDKVYEFNIVSKMVSGVSEGQAYEEVELRDKSNQKYYLRVFKNQNFGVMIFKDVIPAIVMHFY